MRIRSIAFSDHPVLGNLELNFAKSPASAPSDTVILAGDNGCGKTVILNEIFTSLGEITITKRKRVKIEIDFFNVDRTSIKNYLDLPSCSYESATVIHGPDNASSWSNINISLLPHDIGVNEDRRIILPNNEKSFSARPFRVYFSEAAVGFQTTEINTIGASDVDKINAYAIRAGTSIGQQITSLLIDIRAQDNEDYVSWREAHPTGAPPEGLKDRRLSRFKKAIEFMFPSKRFKGVVNHGGKYTIEFDEGGKITYLSDLSTGEKQIIFRGGFILRDLPTIDGSIVLIDEPELSLHPSWQARILSFYRSLLPMGTQLIMATHSPFIIHAQNEDLRLVVLERNGHECREVARPRFAISESDRIVQAFNIPSLISFSNKPLVVLVEGDSDRIILEIAWSRLYPSAAPFFELRSCFSAKAMRTVLNEKSVFLKNPSKKIVGLFDFDAVYIEWKGVWNKDGVEVNSHEASCLMRKNPSFKGWSMLLPVPVNRAHLASAHLASKSALSIEFLFEDADLLPDMVEYLPLPAVGATVPKVKDSVKTIFAEHTRTLGESSFKKLQATV